MTVFEVTYTAANGKKVTAPFTVGVPSNPFAGLPTVPWCGGPAYYGRFAKAASAGWTSPDFFPVAVFYGKPAHTPVLMAAGVNTLMGAEHDGSTMESITDLGMSVLAQDEWTTAEIGPDPQVVGYHIDDEPEMNGAYPDDAARLVATNARVTARRSLNDGRFMQTNFGNGVLDTFWAPGTMPQYMAAPDVSSVDKYAYTSPAVDFEFNRSDAWLKGKPGGAPNRAVAYGWQADQMRSYLASKPVWVFVETARPYLNEAGALSITGPEFAGAVWNALIHGANGIALFQHNNDGRGNYSIVEVPAVNQFVTAVLAQVKALARVLNTQSLVWGFGTGLQTALKVSGAFAYILAMTDGGSGARTFTLPAGVSASSVTVVNESRSLPISGGKFTDSFAAEYTHHIYQLGL